MAIADICLFNSTSHKGFWDALDFCKDSPSMMVIVQKGTLITDVDVVTLLGILKANRLQELEIQETVTPVSSNEEGKFSEVTRSSDS